MKLFEKQIKKPVLTDTTAPKKRQIQFEVKSNMLLKSGADIYSSYSDTRVCVNEFTKYLLVNTDSSKEKIKEEIAEKLETLFEDICVALDADETNFSNEYWYNKELEKQEENS